MSKYKSQLLIPSEHLSRVLGLDDMHVKVSYIEYDHERDLVRFIFEGKEETSLTPLVGESQGIPYIDGECINEIFVNHFKKIHDQDN
ncbi:MAG: hypothetical protein IKF29_04690 [Oceanobacillus sp.]|nr:hypothetical protein [Oceanobacillus sp.]